MKYGEIKQAVMKNDNPVLEPLKNLFIFCDLLNEDYKKEFGEEAPYLPKSDEEI